jgi:hypothetical protein
MAQRMCKHQVFVNSHSQFCIEIECLKHFKKLEVFTELAMPYVSLNRQQAFGHFGQNVRKLENDHFISDRIWSFFIAMTPGRCHFATRSLIYINRKTENLYVIINTRYLLTCQSWILLRVVLQIMRLRDAECCQIIYDKWW